MIAKIKLIFWRKNLVQGELVLVKVSKTIFERCMVTHEPFNGRVIVIRNLQYESVKPSKIYPVSYAHHTLR